MTKRREFISLIGGAAVAWHAAARGARRKGKRNATHRRAPGRNRGRSGVSGPHRGVPEGLALLGWTIGRNVRIDTRWATPNAAEIPDMRRNWSRLRRTSSWTHGASTVGPLLQATRTLPIVFPVVGDPVGAGFVDSLARPGGNATGFMIFEYSMGGKWLELLKQIAPGVTRAAVLRDPTQGSGTSLFAAIQAVAPSLRVEVNPVTVRDAEEIERAVAAFARSPNGGLIMASAPRRRVIAI